VREKSSTLQYVKVCGFTIVRNAVRFDYPIVEAIASILPLCDRFIVAVGDSDDGTRELITSIGDARIEILDTVWDPALKEGGKVLAAETNKALDAIPPAYDWCFYIQADEVVHERYLPAIRSAMEDYLPGSRACCSGIAIFTGPTITSRTPVAGTATRYGSSVTTDRFAPGTMPRDFAGGTAASSRRRNPAPRCTTTDGSGPPK